MYFHSESLLLKTWDFLSVKKIAFPNCPIENIFSYTSSLKYHNRIFIWYLLDVCNWVWFILTFCCHGEGFFKNNLYIHPVIVQQHCSDRSQRNNRRQPSGISSQQSLVYFSYVVIFGIEISSAEEHSAGYFVYQLCMVDAHDATESTVFGYAYKSFEETRISETLCAIHLVCDNR